MKIKMSVPNEKVNEFELKLETNFLLHRDNDDANGMRVVVGDFYTDFIVDDDMGLDDSTPEELQYFTAKFNSLS